MYIQTKQTKKTPIFLTNTFYEFRNFWKCFNKSLKIIVESNAKPYKQTEIDIRCGWTPDFSLDTLFHCLHLHFLHFRSSSIWNTPTLLQYHCCLPSLQAFWLVLQYSSYLSSTVDVYFMFGHFVLWWAIQSPQKSGVHTVRLKTKLRQCIVQCHLK